METLKKELNKLIEQRKRMRKIYHEEYISGVHDQGVKWSYKISREHMDKELKLLNQWKKSLTPLK